MKSRIKSLSLGLIVLMLATASVNTSTAQEPMVGGALIVNLVSEPTTVDPYTLAWNAGHVGAQLFNALLRFDKDLKPEACLATKWQVNPTEGTYSFELRKGVTWHDGKPFTAADVKFTLEELVPKYDVLGSAYFQNTTVTIKDDYNVVVKPRKFLPAVQLWLMASVDIAIYPKHILQGQDFLKSSFRTSDPVGTGPFKMKTWVKGSYIELVRNENYWNKPRPYLEKIIFKFVKDSAAIIAGLQSGEIHHIFRGVPFEAYNTLKETKSLKVVVHPRPPYVGCIYLNNKDPYLSDVNVRRALSYAINRTDIAAKATYGLSKPSQYMIDPEVAPPSSTMTIYNCDPAKANTILDSAGYKKGADGMRFSLELMTRTGEADEQLFSQLVKDQLAKVGINISIKTVDFATFLTLQTKFQFQMQTVKYWIVPPWAYQLFHTEWIGKGQFTNNWQYSNPKVDELFNSWLTEIDPAKQVKILQQVEDILSQDVPELVLYQVAWLNIINTDFEGPDLPTGKHIFADSLEYMYQKSAQKTTTTRPATVTTPTKPAEPQQDYTMIAVAAVVVVVALAAVAMLRRKPAKPAKT